MTRAESVHGCPFPDVKKSLTIMGLLRELRRHGHSDARIALELSQEFAPRQFNRQQVRRLRMKLGLKASRGRPEGGSLWERRRHRWRCFQVREKWGHLLPAYDERLTDRPRGQRWTAGHELRPGQTKILSVLRDQGPLTRRQLALLLGVSIKNQNLKQPAGWLRPLCVAGLIVRESWRYRLAEAARPSQVKRRETGVEQRERRDQRLSDLARKIKAG